MTEDEYGWAQIVAAAVPAVAALLPMVFDGIAKAAQKKKPAGQPAGQRPAPARPGAPAGRVPPELAYLTAVARQQPARFYDALRQVAASAPAPRAPAAPTQVGGDMFPLYNGYAGYGFGGGGDFDAFLNNIMPDQGQLPPWAGPAAAVFGPALAPAIAPFAPALAPMFFQRPGPGGGGGRPPMGRPQRPGARPALSPRLRHAIAQAARNPQLAQAMMVIIRGADGKPRVGIDTGYGALEDFGGLDEIVLGIGIDVDALGAEDFGDDYGDDYGRVGDRMSPNQVLAFLRMVMEANRRARSIEFQSWQMRPQQIRNDIQIPTGRSPAPTAELMKIPMYDSATGTNPRHVLTATGSTPIAAVTLQTRPYNYARYRIVGLETNFGDRSSGSLALVRYLRVQGADLNLIMNDSAAWSDADDWGQDIASSPGLRTGEGSVVDKNGVAQIEVSISGDAGDTAVGSVKLICEKLSDVVSSARLAPVGG